MQIQSNSGLLGKRSFQHESIDNQDINIIAENGLKSMKTHDEKCEKSELI